MVGAFGGCKCSGCLACDARSRTIATVPRARLRKDTWLEAVGRRQRPGANAVPCEFSSEWRTWRDHWARGDWYEVGWRVSSIGRFMVEIYWPHETEPEGHIRRIQNLDSTPKNAQGKKAFKQAFEVTPARRLAASVEAPFAIVSFDTP
jgi:hypothetical protein